LDLTTSLEAGIDLSVEGSPTPYITENITVNSIDITFTAYDVPIPVNFGYPLPMTLTHDSTTGDYSTNIYIYNYSSDTIDDIQFTFELYINFCQDPTGDTNPTWCSLQCDCALTYFGDSVVSFSIYTVLESVSPYADSDTDSDSG